MMDGRLRRRGRDRRGGAQGGTLKRRASVATAASALWVDATRRRGRRRPRSPCSAPARPAGRSVAARSAARRVAARRRTTGQRLGAQGALGVASSGATPRHATRPARGSPATAAGRHCTTTRCAAALHYAATRVYRVSQQAPIPVIADRARRGEPALASATALYAEGLPLP